MTTTHQDYPKEQIAKAKSLFDKKGQSQKFV